jgi:Ca2+:H+ antiporter
VTGRQRVLLGIIVAATIASGALAVGGGPDLATFFVSTAALGGLAWLVSLATEAVGEHVGPALTGVLQSTLGNLPELFVVFFSLRAGELLVAQTSILGSLFANGLLVMGLVILAGARASPDGVMRFQPRLPQDTSTLLILAVFIITLLGLAVTTHDPAARHEVAISVIGAVCLIAVYVVWLLRYLHDDRAPEKGRAETGHPTGGAAGLTLPVAIGLLAVAGVGAALVSDWFVGALAPALTSLHLSRAFAGLVIVAIAGNAVENVAGISLAAKGQSDLAVSVVKNSVSQVAVLLFPLLVLLSLGLSTHLVLVVPPVYLGALGLSALALWQITGDGAAYPFEGLALVVLYVLLAVVAYFE